MITQCLSARMRSVSPCSAAVTEMSFAGKACEGIGQRAEQRLRHCGDLRSASNSARSRAAQREAASLDEPLLAASRSSRAEGIQPERTIVAAAVAAVATPFHHALQQVCFGPCCENGSPTMVK